MKMVMRKAYQDPFYNPQEFSGGAYVGRKLDVDDSGNRRFRYVYGSSPKGWQSIPEGKPSFEIGNKKTGSTIHVSCIKTPGIVRINGTLRNKDGEVIGRINEEYNQGDTYWDDYRKWNPNKSKIVQDVVKRLQMYDRPIKTLRDIDRSMQDTGMHPEDANRAFKASLLNKDLSALRQMRDFLVFSGVTEQTRKQMTQRAKDIFSGLPEGKKQKALDYMFDIIKYDYV